MLSAKAFWLLNLFIVAEYLGPSRSFMASKPDMFNFHRQNNLVTRREELAFIYLQSLLSGYS